MELYYGKGACSMAPHITLIEAGANYKLNALNLAEGVQKKSPFVDINPKGSVPALKNDKGEVFTEVAMILQDIADQFADKNLLPKPGTMERFRAQEWLNYIATEFHKGIGAFFGFSRLLNEQSKKDVREAALSKIKWHFDVLNKHLSQQPFVLGQQFTAPDAYLFTVLGWCKPMQIDLSNYPGITSFMERVGSRPSVQRAMKEEGLI